jgi:ferredoxin
MHKVEVDDGENILDKALDEGIDVPHDCKMGVCMTCPAKLVRNLISWGSSYDSILVKPAPPQHLLLFETPKCPVSISSRFAS